MCVCVCLKKRTKCVVLHPASYGWWTLVFKGGPRGGDLWTVKPQARNPTHKRKAERPLSQHKHLGFLNTRRSESEDPLAVYSRCPSARPRHGPRTLEVDGASSSNSDVAVASIFSPSNCGCCPFTLHTSRPPSRPFCVLRSRSLVVYLPTFSPPLSPSLSLSSPHRQW
jgi:hypothetical protein